MSAIRKEIRRERRTPGEPPVPSAFALRHLLLAAALPFQRDHTMAHCRSSAPLIYVCFETDRKTPNVIKT